MKQSLSLSFFRLFGMLDGLSLLVLLCIAMPLKYMADLPMAVTIAGSIHGFIFVVYVLSIVLAQLLVRWRFYWSLLALLVAVIPVGNLVLDWYIKKNTEKILSS